MSEYHYCRSWFAARKEATEVWSQDQARSQLASTGQVTVLVGSVERPSAVIEIIDNLYFVCFMDEFLRQYLEYGFGPVEENRLFLNSAVYREYAGKTDEIVLGSSFNFDQSGLVYVENQKFKPKFLMESFEAAADIAGHYEEVPEFGRYDKLLILERTNLNQEAMSK